jgi:hypothetical protein
MVLIIRRADLAVLPGRRGHLSERTLYQAQFMALEDAVESLVENCCREKVIQAF